MSVFRCYSEKKPGFDVEARGLCGQLREQLPAFMVPNTLSQVPDFPLTKNGKTDRRKLLEGGWARV